MAGSVVGVDIDIADDAELALRIEQLARERLGDTPAVRIGQPPKRLLVYRTAAPFKGLKCHPLEVLCLGQQFVAYAIHPGTGRPYEWPEQGLADLDIGRLPAIDEEQARAFLEEATVLLPQAMRRPRSLRLRGHPAAATPSRERPKRWRPRSPFFPMPTSTTTAGCASVSRSRAPWAMAAPISSRPGPRSRPGRPAFTAKTWAGFRPTSIGAGTIYHLALERGWKPDVAIKLDGSTPHDAVHPAAGMLAKIQSGRAYRGVAGQSPPALTLSFPTVS